MDKTRVDLVSEKMISHKVKNLEKTRDFMIISVDTFNGKVVEIVFVRFRCICTCVLVLIYSWHSIRRLILIMCNVTSKYVCWFFGPLVASLKMITCIMCEVLPKHMCWYFGVFACIVVVHDHIATCVMSF